MSDTATAARPTAHGTDDQSLGSLVSAATQQVSTLVRKEIELAKTELAASAKGAGLGIGLLLAAALLGLFVMIFFSLGLAWLLDDVMPRSLAFALVGLLYALIAGVLALIAKRKLTGVGPPKRTVAAVKADLALAKPPAGSTQR